MHPTRKHPKDQSFLELYKKAGLIVFPIDKNRDPVLTKWKNGKSVKLLHRITAVGDDWDWSNPSIHDAAIACGLGPGQCKEAGHTICGSGVMGIDYDKLKEKDPGIHMSGVVAFKKMLRDEYSLGFDEMKEAPLPILRSRSGGYHTYHLIDPRFRSGNNRMLKAKDGRIPLVDVKGAPHYQISVPMGTDSEMRWINPIWDEENYPLTKPTKTLRQKFLHDTQEDYEPDTEVSGIIENPPPIAEVVNLIDLLSEETICDRNKWLALGHNLAWTYGKDGREAWDYLCDKYPYKQKDSTSATWRWMFRQLKKPVWSDPIGGFKCYAKQDSPDRYEELYPSKKVTASSDNYSALADGDNEQDQVLFLASELKGYLYFLREEQKWLYWDDESKLWVKTKNISFIASIIGEKLSKIFSELIAHTKGKETKELCAKLSKLQSIKKRTDLAKGLMIHLPDDGILNKLDSMRELFPIADGKVVNLRNGEVRDRTFDDYFSRTSDVEIGGHDSKTLHAYLDSLFPNPEVKYYMQCLIGLFLTGEFYKAFWVIVGQSDSGKSTFIQFVRSLFTQQLACRLKRQVLLGKPDKKAGASDPELIPIIGRRLGVISETSGKDQFNHDRVKELTGDDGLALRANYENETEIDEIFMKIVLVCNPGDVPKFNCQDKAIVNRANFIPFNQSFPESDKAKIEKLKRNPFFRNDFFAWAVKGASNFYRIHDSKLPEVPAELKMVTQANIKDQDTVQLFLEEEDCIRVDSTKKDWKIKSSDLYASYMDFCIHNQFKKLPQKDFNSQLQLKGFSTKRMTKGIFWFGIREPTDDEE